MPFAQAVVPPRQHINEVFGNAQNILEKTSVSHMIGLLQQLNKVSTYASEVFADIFAETEKNSKRIEAVKGRLRNLESKTPKVEKMFADNAPSYFYDHPFTQREWQRKDPLHGLIFRRDRCSAQVNRRRTYAAGAPDFSVMDQFSASGPCIKNYSDPNFFMNEWLEAEKRKMEEERAKRKQRKERKKKKAKREVKRTIQAVQKKTYNALGAEFGDATVNNTEVAVQQYNLSDENAAAMAENRAGSPPVAKKRQSKKMAVPGIPHGKQASYINLPTGGPPNSPPNASGPPAVPPVGGAGAGGGPPPPVPNASGAGPAGAGGPPPPVPAVPMGVPGGPGGAGGPPPPIPNVPGGPPMIPPTPQPMQQMMQQQAPAQPKRPLTGAEMAARSAQMMGDYPPPAAVVQQPVEPAKPKMPMRSMNFLSEIKGGTKLKAVGNIKREKPVDARSMLLANLKQGANLKKVDMSKIEKKEVEVDKTVHAILQRRAFLEDDDSDEESDESWGSESD